MTEVVVERLEVVEVDEHHAQRDALPVGAAHLAHERLFEVAPVEAAGERIADRLGLEPLTKRDVRDGEAEVVGDGVDEARLGRLARDVVVVRELEVQQTLRAALRHERQAHVREVAGAGVAAVEREELSHAPVRTSAPQRPAVLGVDDRRHLVLTEGRDHLAEAVVLLQHVHRARVLGEDALEEEVDDLARVVHAAGALQQLAHVREQPELLCAGFHLRDALLGARSGDVLLGEIARGPEEDPVRDVRVAGESGPAMLAPRILQAQVAPRGVARGERSHHRVEFEPVRGVDPVPERDAGHELGALPEVVLQALVEHPQRATEAGDEQKIVRGLEEVPAERLVH